MTRKEIEASAAKAKLKAIVPISEAAMDMAATIAPEQKPAFAGWLRGVAKKCASRQLAFELRQLADAL